MIAIVSMPAIIRRSGDIRPRPARGFGKISGFLHGGSPATFVLARFPDSCSAKSPRKPGIGKNPGFLHRLGPFGATGIPDSCREVRFSGRKLQESAFLAATPSARRRPPQPQAPIKIALQRLFDKAGRRRRAGRTQPKIGANEASAERPPPESGTKGLSLCHIVRFRLPWR